jgi:hypothetical protein
MVYGVLSSRAVVNLWCGKSLTRGQRGEEKDACKVDASSPFRPCRHCQRKADGTGAEPTTRWTANVMVVQKQRVAGNLLQRIRSFLLGLCSIVMYGSSIFRWAFSRSAVWGKLTRGFGAQRMADSSSLPILAANGQRTSDGNSVDPTRVAANVVVMRKKRPGGNILTFQELCLFDSAVIFGLPARPKPLPIP